MKRILLFLSMLLAAITAGAKDYTLSSPDGRTVVTVSSGNELRWSVTRDGVPVLMPSHLSLTLSDGTLYGGADRFKAKTFRVSETFATPLYKRAQVENNYNELRLSAKKYQVIFRAYNDGAAYRFETFSAVTVKDETAEFSFPEDATAWIPYVRKKATYEGQFFNSFENTYSVQHISAWEKDRIAFPPVTMTAPGGRKICITEADLLNYPGMYLGNEDGERRVHGVFARYPKAERQGGHNNLQWIVETREDYIYRGEGPEALPWRVLIIADSDKEYYIDFASSCGVGYVILDEGWAVNKKADLMRIVPEIDLPELARYAESKGVRLVLWAGYAAFEKDICTMCLSDLPSSFTWVEKDSPADITFWGRTPVEKVTSLFIYKGKYKELLYSIKYRGNAPLAIRMGKMLGEHIAPEGIEFIVPVPLHPKKKRRRGYNQSEMIARGIAESLRKRGSDVSVETHLVLRSNFTPTQTRKDRIDRWLNVRNAFVINQKRLSKLSTPSASPNVPLKILLVDDVLTTGATLDACASLLHQAAQCRISIATLAYVP